MSPYLWRLRCKPTKQEAQAKEHPRPESSHECSQASSAAQPSARKQIKNLKLEQDVHSRFLKQALKRGEV